MLFRSPAHPDAPGELFFTASAPEFLNLNFKLGAAAETKSGPQKIVIERAVLISRQTRAAQDEIDEVIRRVESGDPRKPAMGGFGGGGGGGCGGGFFSVPGAALIDGNVSNF